MKIFVSPARFKKQSEYSAALGEQVDMKTKMKHQRRTEREHAEREEQYNLAKEIQDHAQQKHDTSRKSK